MRGRDALQGNFTGLPPIFTRQAFNFLACCASPYWPPPRPPPFHASPASTPCLPSCPATNPLTKHLSVALLDKQPPVRMPAITNLPPHADIRVSTLTPASVALLRSVGAWRTLAPAAAPFCDMQVSRP